MKIISMIIILGVIFFAYKSCTSTPKDKFISISTAMCSSNQVPKKLCKCLAEEVANNLNEEELKLATTPMPEYTQKQMYDFQNKILNIMFSETTIKKCKGKI